GPGVHAGEARVPFSVGRTQQKTVVTLRTAGIKRIHAPENGFGPPWIRQLQQPPLIHVRELAARAGRGQPVLSGGAGTGDVLSRIQLEGIPQVDQVRTHIASRYEYAGGHLPLDGHTPRLLLCIRQIRLVRVEPLIRWKSWERGALGVDIWERISAWNICIRIAKIQRPIQSEPRDKRRDPRRILQRKSLEEIMGDSPIGADRRFSIAEGVVCKADARLKLIPDRAYA